MFRILSRVPRLSGARAARRKECAPPHLLLRGYTTIRIPERLVETDYEAQGGETSCVNVRKAVGSYPCLATIQPKAAVRRTVRWSYLSRLGQGRPGLTAIVGLRTSVVWSRGTCASAVSSLTTSGQWSLYPEVAKAVRAEGWLGGLVRADPLRDIREAASSLEGSRILHVRRADSSGLCSWY